MFELYQLGYISFTIQCSGGWYFELASFNCVVTAKCSALSCFKPICSVLFRECKSYNAIHSSVFIAIVILHGLSRG